MAEVHVSGEIAAAAEVNADSGDGTTTSSNSSRITAAPLPRSRLGSNAGMSNSKNMARVSPTGHAPGADALYALYPCVLALPASHPQGHAPQPSPSGAASSSGVSIGSCSNSSGVGGAGSPLHVGASPAASPPTSPSSSSDTNDMVWLYIPSSFKLPDRVRVCVAQETGPRRSRVLVERTISLLQSPSAAPSTTSRSSIGRQSATRRAPTAAMEGQFVNVTISLGDVVAGILIVTLCSTEGASDTPGGRVLLAVPLLVLPAAAAAEASQLFIRMVSERVAEPGSGMSMSQVVVEEDGVTSVDISLPLVCRIFAGHFVPFALDLGMLLQYVPLTPATRPSPALLDNARNMLVFMLRQRMWSCSCELTAVLADRGMLLGDEGQPVSRDVALAKLGHIFSAITPISPVPQQEETPELVNATLSTTTPEQDTAAVPDTTPPTPDRKVGTTVGKWWASLSHHMQRNSSSSSTDITSKCSSSSSVVPDRGTDALAHDGARQDEAPFSKEAVAAGMGSSRSNASVATWMHKMTWRNDLILGLLHLFVLSAGLTGWLNGFESRDVYFIRLDIVLMVLQLFPYLAMLLLPKHLYWQIRSELFTGMGAGASVLKLCRRRARCLTSSREPVFQSRLLVITAWEYLVRPMLLQLETRHWCILCAASSLHTSLLFADIMKSSMCATLFTGALCFASLAVSTFTEVYMRKMSVPGKGS